MAFIGRIKLLLTDFRIKCLPDCILLLPLEFKRHLRTLRVIYIYQKCRSVKHIHARAFQYFRIARFVHQNKKKKPCKPSKQNGSRQKQNISRNKSQMRSYQQNAIAKCIHCNNGPNVISQIA